MDNKQVNFVILVVSLPLPVFKLPVTEKMPIPDRDGLNV